MECREDRYRKSTYAYDVPIVITEDMISLVIR